MAFVCNLEKHIRQIINRFDYFGDVFILNVGHPGYLKCMDFFPLTISIGISVNTIYVIFTIERMPKPRISVLVAAVSIVQPGSHRLL